MTLAASFVIVRVQPKLSMYGTGCIFVRRVPPLYGPAVLLKEGVCPLQTQPPHPPIWQFRQVGGVRGGGFLVLAPRFLRRLPAGAALGQDALQQDAGGLIVTALGAGQLRLGGDQPALAGGLEDAGPVALQVGPRPPQRGHRRVQPRELRLDFSDDAVLLGQGRKGDLLGQDVSITHCRVACAPLQRV